MNHLIRELQNLPPHEREKRLSELISPHIGQMIISIRESIGIGSVATPIVEINTIHGCILRQIEKEIFETQ